MHGPLFSLRVVRKDRLERLQGKHVYIGSGSFRFCFAVYSLSFDFHRSGICVTYGCVARLVNQCQLPARAAEKEEEPCHVHPRKINNRAARACHAAFSKSGCCSKLTYTSPKSRVAFAISFLGSFFLWL